MSEKYFALQTENGLVTLAQIEGALADAGLEVIDTAEARKITARMAVIENKLEDNLRLARELETRMDELWKSRDHWIEEHAALTVRSALERTTAKNAETLAGGAERLLRVAVMPSALLASQRDSWLQAYDDRKRNNARSQRLLDAADKEGKTE